jgi:hypothetical protein
MINRTTDKKTSREVETKQKKMGQIYIRWTANKNQH